MNTPGARRIARKQDVRDWLIKHGDSTLNDIATSTGLTASAVSKALQDIRNDPALEYMKVPTKDGDYKYGVAYTVAEMKAGLRNQMLHLQTRAESLIIAGDKGTVIAATPDDYALSADMKANGNLMRAQAEAILKALA